MTYLSEALFGEVVEGRLDTLDFYERLLAPGELANKNQPIEPVGPAAIGYAERQAVAPEGAFEQWLLETEAVQRNHIGRVAGGTVAGLLFYDNEIFFRPKAGLWCLVRTDKATLENRIRPALRYLADTGLGANRTAGKGQFDIEVTAAPRLPDAGEAATGLVMLSRYIPKPDDWPVTGRPLAYKMMTFIAWREKKFGRPAPGQATAPVYKRQLRMLAPGCVVPLHQGENGIYGRLDPESGEMEVFTAPRGFRNWQSNTDFLVTWRRFWRGHYSFW